MSAELNLAAGNRIEFAYGRVVPGKENWMYQEYFPKYAPIMAEFGLVQMAAFGVIATNVTEMPELTGSFGAWPSVENRDQLHVDPRFTNILPERDAALELLSDGHLFSSIDEVIALNTDRDYAIVITSDGTAIVDPILALLLTDDSTNDEFAGQSLYLLPWNDVAERLLKTSANEASVFRVRFNPAG